MVLCLPKFTHHAYICWQKHSERKRMEKYVTQCQQLSVTQHYTEMAHQNLSRIVPITLLLQSLHQCTYILLHSIYKQYISKPFLPVSTMACREWSNVIRTSSWQPGRRHLHADDEECKDSWLTATACTKGVHHTKLWSIDGVPSSNIAIGNTGNIFQQK